jgi:hypothetical protein
MRIFVVSKSWPRLVLGLAAATGLAIAGSGSALAASGASHAAAILSAPEPHPTAPACTVHWTGMGDSPQWTIAQNWSTGKVPGATSDVCITSTGVDVLTDVSINVHSIRIGAAEGIALEGTTARPLTATIATSLTLGGSNLTRLDLTDATISAEQISDSEGTVFTDGNVTLNSPDIAFSNGGGVEAANGTTTLTSLPQLKDGTLSDATFNTSGGTIVLPGDITHLVSASIVVGANSAINDPARHNALAGLRSLDSQSELADQSALALTGSLVSHGNVFLGGPAVSLAGTLTQAAGTLDVGTNLSASQVMVGEGATLQADSADATIAGNLVNGGTVQTVNTLNVTGNYTQATNAALDAGFGAPVAVTGTATLAGSVSTIEELPQPGDTEPVITFGSLSGNFTSQTPGFMRVTRTGEIDAIIVAQIAATPTRVAPDGSVTVTGASFILGSTVSIWLNHVGGTPLGTGHAGYGGRFSVPVTIPESAGAGNHTLIAVGASNGGRARTTIKVT